MQLWRLMVVQYLGTPSSGNNSNNIVNCKLRFTQFGKDFLIQRVDLAIGQTKNLGFVDKSQKLFEFSGSDFARLILVNKREEQLCADFNVCGEKNGNTGGSADEVDFTLVFGIKRGVNGLGDIVSISIGEALLSSV